MTDKNETVPEKGRVLVLTDEEENPDQKLGAINVAMAAISTSVHLQKMGVERRWKDGTQLADEYARGYGRRG